MFAICARMVPNAGLREIRSALTVTTLSATATEVPVSTKCWSSAFGPFTRTMPSPTVTGTPAGIGTGFLPTRDIPLPSLTRPGRRARPRDPPDHAGVLARVLQVHAQHALFGVLDDLEIVDEPLAQQHLGDLFLQPRRRHVQLAMLRADGVADAGEEIRHGITDRHETSVNQRPTGRSRLQPDSCAPRGARDLCVLRFRLPARLDDARDLTRERQLAEADAAHPEVPQERARPAAAMAPVVGTPLELRGPLPLLDDRLLRHEKPPPASAAGTACS